MTEDEKKVQFEIRQRLMADIRRLREERDEWKERYEAERRDHEATIRHSNKMLSEDSYDR